MTPTTKPSDRNMELAEAIANEWYSTKEQYVSRLIRLIAYELEAKDQQAKELVTAIEQSIARADDYGDSYCSRPIRDELARYHAANGGKS